MKRHVLAIATSVFVVGGAPAGAQSACFGPACPPSDTIGIGNGPDFFGTYRGYWPMDVYQAGTQWALTQTTPFETREQCVANCKQEYLADLQLCQNTHGIPTPGEDAAVSQSRINCAEAMRRREIQCISPASLLNCPDY